MSAEIQKYISESFNSLNLISRRIEFETLQDRISSKTTECENPEIWKDQALAKSLMRERQGLLEQFETFSKLQNELNNEEFYISNILFLCLLVCPKHQYVPICFIKRCSAF